GEQQDLSAVHLRRRAARLPQRHHAALRRSGREAGVVADARALQQIRARRERDGIANSPPRREGGHGESFLCVARVLCGGAFQTNSVFLVSGIQIHATAASRNAAPAIVKATPKPLVSAAFPTVYGAAALAIRPKL